MSLILASASISFFPINFIQIKYQKIFHNKFQIVFHFPRFNLQFNLLNHFFFYYILFLKFRRNIDFRFLHILYFDPSIFTSSHQAKFFFFSICFRFIYYFSIYSPFLRISVILIWTFFLLYVQILIFSIFSSLFSNSRFFYNEFHFGFNFSQYKFLCLMTSLDLLLFISQSCQK